VLVAMQENLYFKLYLVVDVIFITRPVYDWVIFQIRTQQFSDNIADIKNGINFPGLNAETNIPIQSASPPHGSNVHKLNVLTNDWTSGSTN
jgi:hypothetical protein